MTHVMEEYMLKQLQRQFIFALIFFLAADLLFIYFTTADSSAIPRHLQARLNHQIEVIDQTQINKTEFILYHDLATNQLDTAWYKPNTLLFWRYNFSGAYTTSNRALVNRCQTYYTSEYFIIWGRNEDLKAKTLKITLNHETFIEDISQDLYFINVYPFNHQIPDTIYCSFYDENQENISSYFFDSLNR